ncbi:MAG TPA: hypothetical protein VJ571_08015 [Candidatus Nitrosotalea sp.]|nr:hypothetical protein [Candidatus Nitrosotalea sp.]
MLKIAIIAAITILLAPMATSSFAQVEFDKTFPAVGKDAGDGATTFDVPYSSVKNIVSASVSVKDKSVSFVLVGNAETNSHLILKIPTGLVSGFIGVFVDGQIITNYTTTNETTDTIVSIPITPLSENVSLVGTTVVPEFGPVAAIVLAVSIVAIVTITRLGPIRL